MIITAALGGVGTLLGPLLGAAILVPLKTATNSLFGGGGSGLTYILYGGIILLLARFEPGGLLELWRRLTAGKIRRKLKTHAAFGAIRPPRFPQLPRAPGGRTPSRRSADPPPP